METPLHTRNVQRAVTFDRFLYAALEAEAEKLGIKVSHVINAELSKTFQDKIQLLKLQDKAKYN
jgi:hypothetical protein